MSGVSIAVKFLETMLKIDVWDISDRNIGKYRSYQGNI